MQGLHVFEPKTRTVIDLESFIPEDHLLRQIDRIVEPAFIRKLTASCFADGKGRPSIDPVVYFRMVLLSYLYGIDKDRRLCEEVHFNLAYRWFCRLSLEDEVPDHSSLSRTRDRYGAEIYEAVFHEIVKRCQEHGLVGEKCCVMTDATLIPADAALDSLVHNDPEQAREEAEALQGRTRAIEPPATRSISNQTHTSRTDPNATLAQKRGTPRQLKYKVHLSIDADSRVILDTHVTTGARHDNQPYLDQLKRIRERYAVTIQEAIADRGYGVAAIIRKLHEQGAQTYIPLWSRRSGQNSSRTEGFVYERERDRFLCPEGKYLNAFPATYENYKRYVSSREDCCKCPQALVCPAKRKKADPDRRHLIRSQDLFEEVEAHMRDPVFRQKLSERMWKIEGLFAEAKQNHGLSRARYRGRAKVQIQAYMSATAQNLKRLVKAFLCWLVVWLSHRRRNITQLA